MVKNTDVIYKALSNKEKLTDEEIKSLVHIGGRHKDCEKDDTRLFYQFEGARKKYNLTIATRPDFAYKCVCDVNLFVENHYMINPFSPIKKLYIIGSCCITKFNKHFENEDDVHLSDFKTCPLCGDRSKRKSSVACPNGTYLCNNCYHMAVCQICKKHTRSQKLYVCPMQCTTHLCNVCKDIKFSKCNECENATTVCRYCHTYIKSWETYKCNVCIDYKCDQCKILTLTKCDTCRFSMTFCKICRLNIYTKVKYVCPLNCCDDDMTWMDKCGDCKINVHTGIGFCGCKDCIALMGCVACKKNCGTPNYCRACIDKGRNSGHCLVCNMSVKEDFKNCYKHKDVKKTKCVMCECWGFWNDTLCRRCKTCDDISLF